MDFSIINAKRPVAQWHGGIIFPKHISSIRMHSKRVFLLSRHLYDT